MPSVVSFALIHICNTQNPLKYLLEGWGIKILLLLIILNPLPEISIIFCSSRAFQQLLPCSNLSFGLEVTPFRSSSSIIGQRPHGIHVGSPHSYHLTWHGIDQGRHTLVMTWPLEGWLQGMFPEVPKFPSTPVSVIEVHPPLNPTVDIHPRLMHRLKGL
jgi:hypothetical protein